MEAYRDRYAEIQKLHGRVIAVSTDDAETLRSWRTELKAPQTFVADPDQKLVKLFDTKLPIIGITNGMSDSNRPENIPELKADVLQALQTRRGAQRPIFANPVTQTEMLARDHNFDVHKLAVKADLKRLLHLEAFGTEPVWDPILITAVGRLVEQKNLGLVADVIERTVLCADDRGARR